MITFDEATAIITREAEPLGTERIAINEGHGRVLAEPVIAGVDAPPADVSAMDGYAVSEDALLLLPARLRVAGESFAGSNCGGTIASDECVRIFTGAPLPNGADRVVIQEVVRRDDDVAVIEEFPGAARHVRRQGSDFAAGEMLIPQGTRLGYRELVAAAGADLGEIIVWRRPIVAIVGTGDELVEPGQAASRAGAIPESVSFGVAALSGEWGAQVQSRLRLPDELATMRRAATDALANADLVIVTGGASVGEKDFAKGMFADAGLELLFSKVSIKPGKPVWLGRAGGKLVMGLPGNPTSALVTARVLLAPLLAGLTGRDPKSALAWRDVRLLAQLPECGDRETFVRARSVDGTVEPISNQDSSAQKALVSSDLLIRRRAGAAALAAGEQVPVLDF